MMTILSPSTSLNSMSSADEPPKLYTTDSARHTSLEEQVTTTMAQHLQFHGSLDGEEESGTHPETHHNTIVTIDQAVDSIGYGPFQYRMLLAAGLCSASDAMEILLLSFLRLAVQVDWDLTVGQTDTLLSVVFLGALVGTLVLGRLGDTWGRRPTFLLTASLVAFFGLVSSGSPTYPALIAARFGVGLGVGGVTIPYDTYGEFLPTEMRGKGLMYPSYFWTAGTVLIAVAAQWTLGDDPTRWRWLCLVGSIPSVVALLVGVFVVPESPRWLLCHEQNPQAALRVLRRVARLNGFDPYELFPPETILKDELYSEDTDRSNPTKVFWELLSPPWLQAFVALFLVWFCYAFMYYGTILTVTGVFSSTNVAEASSSGSMHIDYTAIVLSSAAEVLGATLLVLTMDFWGRRSMHAVSFSVGGLLGFVLRWMIHSSAVPVESYGWIRRMVTLSVAFFARLFVFCGSSLTWIWTAELFTTAHRSTGHGMTNAGGRLGGLLAPYAFISQNGETTSVQVGALILFVTTILVAAARTLPETKGLPMGSAVPLAAQQQYPDDAIDGVLECTSTPSEIGTSATRRSFSGRGGGPSRRGSSSTIAATIRQQQQHQEDGLYQRVPVTR